MIVYKELLEEIASEGNILLFQFMTTYDDTGYADIFNNANLIELILCFHLSYEE